MNCNINFFLTIFFNLCYFSLKEVERYENEGIRIRRQKVKTQDKEESNRKTKEETKVSVLTFKMKSSSSQQIPHHIFLTHLLPLVKIY